MDTKQEYTQEEIEKRAKENSEMYFEELKRLKKQNLINLDAFLIMEIADGHKTSVDDDVLYVTRDIVDGLASYSEVLDYLRSISKRNCFKKGN